VDELVRIIAKRDISEMVTNSLKRKSLGAVMKNKIKSKKNIKILTASMTASQTAQTHKPQMAGQIGNQKRNRKK